MLTVYCYPVKLTIADLIRAKSICSDSVQPYNKPIIDLACSVCTVKYQTSVFCMDLAPSSLGPYTKKPRSDISQYRPHAHACGQIMSAGAVLTACN